MEEKSKKHIESEVPDLDQSIDKRDVSELIPDTSWTPRAASKAKFSRKNEEEQYAGRFLAIRKVKDYTPVYIDMRMKEKLQRLVQSLQYIAPEITPTILLSNILADHLVENRELITRAANEGLKRSLASTFNEEK